jgi:hypothetical protein
VTFHTKYTRALNFENLCHSYLIRLGFDSLKHDLQAAEAHEMSEAHVAQLLPRPLALEPEVTAANWQRLRSRQSIGASCSLPESPDSIHGAQETVHDREQDAAARAHTHMGVMQRGSVGLVDCTDDRVAEAGSCTAVGPFEHTVLFRTEDEHLARNRFGLSGTGNEFEDAHARVHKQADLLATPVGVLPTTAHEAAAACEPGDRQHNSAEKLVTVKEEQEESSDRVREATSAQMPRPAPSLAHVHTYMTVERVKFVAVDEIKGQSNSEVALKQEWGGKQQA